MIKFLKEGAFILLISFCFFLLMKIAIKDAMREVFKREGGHDEICFCQEAD